MNSRDVGLELVGNARQYLISGVVENAGGKRGGAIAGGKRGGASAADIGGNAVAFPSIASAQLLEGSAAALPPQASAETR
jgi:hypothetical protein